MRDKHLWIFNSGDSFDGNPKWLFLYLANHRKDIKLYWFCYKKETADYIGRLGYRACLFDSKTGEKIGSQAGVYVVNQKKEVFQEYLHGITILNLWHGVGCKTVEKGVTYGFLQERIIKKHIQNMEYYKKYQLFLVTSPIMEKHFMEQCDVDADKVIRAGYPCCVYQEKVETFPHDIRKQKELPSDTKLAVYAPTYRDFSATDFFSKAIPDMERLIQVLEKNNFALIFKMHPKMSADFHYQNAVKLYGNHPRLIFWDNANDFYEIMDQIELAIIDYSSIFYDMLARGVKNFVRYIFDYGAENTMRDFALDYMENTCGKVCSDYSQLLDAFTDYHSEPKEIARIKERFWAYSDEHSLERIVDRALTFEPDESLVLPTLYSFDIFDTLIGRTTLKPAGVFYYVQDKMQDSDLGYPAYVKNNFFKIRPWAESNMREYYRKSKNYRKSNRTEITFDMIYDRIQELFSLTDAQTAKLKEWELECEYQTSIPYPERIDLIHNLLDEGNTVILISDMYLPKEFVKKLLAKADPVLAELPLFLSSDYGTQKTTKELFFEAYHELHYQFGKWIHYGDGPKADGSLPRQLGIETENHTIPSMNGYENGLTNFARTYDSFQIAALFARFRADEHTTEEIYAYCYVSLYWVPYVNWAIRHAMERGTECLYFISRDGYHLKRIADAIIAEKHLNIKTKYIYGSRKAWRIPSQIHEIDEEFFSEFGNFAGVEDFEALLTAGDMTEEEFDQIFPEMSYLKESQKITKEMLLRIREVFSSSEKYRHFLLKKAAEERVIVLDYLRQEIDFSEKYAFVEYWGRGYTQTCLANLICEASGEISDNIFYYARSIYPSQGHIIRYNFTGNNYSLIFIESIFANLPYRSVAAYEKRDGRIKPVLKPCDNNMAIHEALETWLPAFATDFCRMKLENEQSIERTLYDWGLSYFHNHKSAKIFNETVATFMDSVSLYSSAGEYAPPIDGAAIKKWLKGEKFKTKDFKMSLARSSPFVKKAYRFYKKHVHKTWLASLIQKLRRRGNT